MLALTLDPAVILAWISTTRNGVSREEIRFRRPKKASFIGEYNAPRYKSTCSSQRRRVGANFIGGPGEMILHFSQ
jgi:hypothetical protein